MSMLNIVIHMAFATTGVPSGQAGSGGLDHRVVSARKIPNEHPNKYPVNCKWSLTYIHLAAPSRFYLFSLASPH
jgi:hypothetical protein